MHRISLLGNHFDSALLAAQEAAKPAGKKDSLSVVDNRTGKFFIEIENLMWLDNLYRQLECNCYSFIGKTYELPIKDGAINATDLAKIKDEQGEVTRSYDPAYMNTVACVRFIFEAE